MDRARTRAIPVSRWDSPRPGRPPSDIVHTPILTDQLTWTFDDSRHLMRSVDYVKRNEIFGELFRRLAERAR